MNSKETILKVANLKKTSRIPVALLSGGAWTFNRRGISLEEGLKLGAEECAKILEETNEEIKSDIVWPGAGYHNLTIRAIGGKVKFREEGSPDIQELLFKEASDVDNIDLSLIKKDVDLNILYETTSLLSKKIGKTTIIGTSYWGPFTLAGLLYGAENLMRNIYKDKKTVHKILEFTTELCYQYLEAYVEAGAELVAVAEPTSSGDMISRQQFRNFSLPYLKKVVQRFRKKGLPVSIHICGNTTNILDLIPETGANIISIDYKVPLIKAKELVGSKMAIAGNMNPVDVMENMSAEEVASACQKCINEAEGINYISMPGCDIPPGVPVENIKAMVRIAHGHKIEV